ncbi:MAG: hypothetical protein K8R53_01260, partial [Bacteroidales bacterium]|nr:hypothetical protein [Bacteroidales bacterium]
LINPMNDKTIANIGYLIKNEKENKGLDFNDFRKIGLDGITLSDDRITEASSKFINIFYEASVEFSKLNYNVN